MFCPLTAEEEQQHDWVRLNVRGQLFDTLRTTLLGQPDTFFEALLSSGAWEPNQRGVPLDHSGGAFLGGMRPLAGQYEIDRSPTYFAHILLYLHSGKLDVWAFSDEQLRVWWIFFFFRMH